MSTTTNYPSFKEIWHVLDNSTPEHEREELRAFNILLFPFIVLQWYLFIGLMTLVHRGDV
jgi:hypothetical protein